MHLCHRRTRRRQSLSARIQLSSTEFGFHHPAVVRELLPIHRPASVHHQFLFIKFPTIHQVSIVEATFLLTYYSLNYFWIIIYYIKKQLIINCYTRITPLTPTVIGSIYPCFNYSFILSQNYTIFPCISLYIEMLSLSLIMPFLNFVTNLFQPTNH